MTHMDKGNWKNVLPQFGSQDNNIGSDSAWMNGTHFEVSGYYGIGLKSQSGDKFR